MVEYYSFLLGKARDILIPKKVFSEYSGFVGVFSKQVKHSASFSGALVPPISRMTANRRVHAETRRRGEKLTRLLGRAIKVSVALSPKPPSGVLIVPVLWAAV